MNEPVTRDWHARERAAPIIDDTAFFRGIRIGLMLTAALYAVVLLAGLAVQP